LLTYAGRDDRQPQATPESIEHQAFALIVTLVCFLLKENGRLRTRNQMKQPSSPINGTSPRLQRNAQPGSGWR
jgi:hypothetical protein